jgi:hypothetical protein
MIKVQPNESLELEQLKNWDVPVEAGASCPSQGRGVKESVDDVDCGETEASKCQ